MPRRARDADHEREAALMRQIGVRLLSARLDARMTQAALGARVGVTNIQIGCYERGATALSLHRAVLLAEALGLEPNALVPASDPAPRPQRRRVEDYPELFDLYRQLGQNGRKKVFSLLRRLLHRGDAD